MSNNQKFRSFQHFSDVLYMMAETFLRNEATEPTWGGVKGKMVDNYYDYSRSLTLTCPSSFLTQLCLVCTTSGRAQSSLRRSIVFDCVLLLLIVTVVFNATLAQDSKYQNSHDFDEKRSTHENLLPKKNHSFLSRGGVIVSSLIHILLHIVDLSLSLCLCVCLSLGAPYRAMSNGCLVSIITFSWQLLGKGMHWSQTPRG